MQRVATTVVVPAGEVAAWLTPRTDVVSETEAVTISGGGDGARFELAEGPFTHYEREVAVTPRGDGTAEVAQRVTFRLGVPFWGAVFVPGMRRVLRRPPAHGARAPWWAPPARLDARAARSLGLLCSISIVGGFLGTIITQTITFAAEEFDVSTTAQAGALAATRLGVVVAVVLAAVADRTGRRRGVLVAGVAGCVLAVTGALAPTLGWLTVSQAVARGFATALLLLVAIISAEEMPAGSRAYAVSLLALTQALGAGMCLWVLPVADLGPTAWRLVYVVPLVFLPVVATVHRRLPESKRFARPHPVVALGLAGRARAVGDRVRATGRRAKTAGADRDGMLRTHGARLVLLATVSFLLAVFATPVSQLQNEFLRTDRGFSASRVTLFTLVTATPGGIGVIVGGRLADVRGRRWVAAVGVIGGTVLTVLAYRTQGWPMWVLALFGAMIAGATVPALGVYRPELFPTSLRGRSSGIIDAIGLAGSAAGLLLVGSLVDGGGTFGGFGNAFALVAIAPVIAIVLVLTRFPETAQRELEDINPEDRTPSDVVEGAAAPIR